MAIIYEGFIKTEHRKACRGGGCIGLIFGDSGTKLASSVKIIREKDSPADWLAVARDVGRECIALFHLSPEEVQSLPKRNIWIAESLFHKLAIYDWCFRRLGTATLASLTKAEAVLGRILTQKGLMLGISNRVLEAAMSV